MADIQNIDVAPFLDAAGTRKKKDEEQGEVRSRLEILEALLLGLVAILTAWSGYQATRWDGRNALNYGGANRDRVMATRQATLGGQQQLFDAITFNVWLQAVEDAKPKLATLYEHRFSGDYRIAFDAWMKTDPLHNPKAAPDPSFMPEYHNSSMDQAASLDQVTTGLFEEGTAARERGDDYVRNTVLLSTVLFLVAVGQTFKIARVRKLLLVPSFLLVIIGVLGIVSYPIA